MQTAPLLSTKKVAELFGVTPGTVSRWAKAKVLPSVKIGKKLFFKPEDLEKLLTTQP